MNFKEKKRGSVWFDQTPMGRCRLCKFWVMAGNQVINGMRCNNEIYSKQRTGTNGGNCEGFAPKPNVFKFPRLKMIGEN